MEDTSWKDRIKTEYEELHEKYLKLKAFNTKCEVKRCTTHYEKVDPSVEYGDSLLCRQEEIMREYLHILELRAVLHDIEL